MKKFFDWTERKLEILWNKAEAAAENDDRSLSILRISYGLFIIVFATPSFSWISKVPQSLFLPPTISLANLFDGFPSYAWLLVIDVSLFVCSICLLFGVKARYAGILFSALDIIGSSFSFSFGKIDHFIMFPVFIFGLSFTNWGVGYALIPDKEVAKKQQRRVLAILAVILCFGMFTAGFEKARHWIDFDLTKGGFIDWFYSGFFSTDRQYFLAPFILIIPPQTFEIFDYFTVIFELSPIIALISGRKWWLLWLFVASMFHLANTVLLNIPFPVHAPIYLSFIYIRFPLLTNFKKNSNQTKIYLFISTIITIISIHQLFNVVTRNSIEPLVIYALSLMKGRVELSLYVGLLVWLITFFWTGLAVAKAFNIITTPTDKADKASQES